MFSINQWEGLAKIGEYQVNNKSFTTPALMPVVDPKQQYVSIDAFEKEFRIDQVITSAYLMSKRREGENDFQINEKNWDKLPLVKDYIEYKGTIMMDSGAYQVLLYGDIELGVLDTIDLQNSVKPDIGVIMDHPIGYKTTYKEAKQRVATTLSNLDMTIKYLADVNCDVKWTLPIQGGRYIDLLSEYLQKVTKPEIIDNFSFFALGSVVPIMINQDYETLVKMITVTRKYLPVDKPLHLFGAGHPSMFALATFLGCDTFDSAAYALMAKDYRYMTVDGTYQLSDLVEFPCSCKVCASYTVSELNGLDDFEKKNKIAEHNLWVSIEEINRIRNAIRYGRLWELVQQRSASVPKLSRATKLAFKMVTEGDLSDLFSKGIPSSSSHAPRVARKTDVNKIELQIIKQYVEEYLNQDFPDRIVVFAFTMLESIHSKVPEDQITKLKLDIDPKSLFYYLPPFGLVPYATDSIYPISQIVHDLDIGEFDMELLKTQLSRLYNKVKEIHIISPEKWPQNHFEPLDDLNDKITYHLESKPLATLTNIYSE